MNILFITASLSFGGAEKMLCFVASSLSERGYNVFIANLSCTDTDKVSDYQRKINEKIMLFQVPSGSRQLQIKEIIKYSKEHKINAVIGFTSFPNIYSVIIGKALHIPSIISERGDPSNKRPDTTMSVKIKSRICRLIIRGSTGAVFQTEGAKIYYPKKQQKAGIVIPNPIFIDGTVPAVDYDNRTRTVVSVGRLDNYQKRIDVMLKAFKLFSQKHPDYTLKIYGKGIDEDQIVNWIQKLGLNEKVKLLGLTSQSMQDIAHDGMFLITSDFEGISNSLLEAMAVGLPCISTDHSPGGARMLINDHTNGLLVPIRDEKALSNAMCEFAENPELAKKCGSNAKDVLIRFEPNRIIDMWEKYIIDITV